MDFDPNLASTSAQVAMCAMQSQQNHHAAAAVPPGSLRQVVPASACTVKEPMICATENQAKAPANDLTVVRKNRPTTYRDLPPEIIQRVAGYVPFGSISDLATVDRRTYHVLREQRLRYLCYARALHLRDSNFDLASVLQVLAEIERIRANPALRAEPLSMLGELILDLPDAQQPTAFSLIFEAADRMPKKQRLQIQKEMIELISDCPAPQRRKMYNFAYAIAERRGREQDNTWAELASLLEYLSIDRSRFESEYRVFLNRLPNLSVAGQADLITKLAALLARLSYYVDKAKFIEYYEILQQWVQRLPQSHQGAPIGALAEAMWAIPEAQRPEYFTNIRLMTLSLPNHQLGSALRYLPYALMLLPSDLHAYEFSLLETAIQRVEPSQRAAVAFGLLWGTLRLENTLLFKQVWQRALRLLDGGDEMDVVDVLEAMKKYSFTWESSPVKKKNIEIEIMAFVERNDLTQQTRAFLLDYTANKH
ncbi:F-box domain-containing protein [Mycetohabitans sp. B46]|uniref:F-box domain-containing protein n=1 Tax=Mycetohabitans sp. B46 TaxID=2772536 RepID=UPI00307D76ED